MLARYPTKNFTPCPAGLHPAVCVDVVDLGEVDTDFGRKWRVRLAWQIADIDPSTAERFSCVKTYTNSLHKRANLRSDLESWRGKKFSEVEAKCFDLDVLLGANCLLQVVHNTSEHTGDIYANVAIVLPLPKGTAKIAPLNYTRAQDRATRSGASPRPTTTWPAKSAPKAAEPELDTPMPSVAEASMDVPGSDDVDFAFGANTDDLSW
jgi:hypothetical protein